MTVPSLAPNPFDYQLPDGTIDRARIRAALLDHAACCDVAGLPRSAALAVALANGPAAVDSLLASWREDETT